MKTELWVEGERIDLREDEVIILQYSLSSIQDLRKRNDSFSKTVRIPGTNINNRIFGQQYDLQIQTPKLKDIITGIELNSSIANTHTNFNRKKKARFTLLSNGAYILDGIMKLLEVHYENGKITYEVVLYGNFVNLMSELGDKLLEDLDVEDLGHTYTQNTIIESWNPPPFGSDELPYMYPLIDYGTSNTRMSSVPMSTLRPAVRLKWYWDKIFKEAGFTYESDFINSDLIKQLIIPYNGEDFRRLRELDATTASNTALTVFGTVPPNRQNIFNKLLNDGSGNYVNSQYTVGQDDRYSVTIAANGVLRFNYAVTFGQNYTPGDRIVNDTVFFSFQLRRNGNPVAARSYQLPYGSLSTVNPPVGFPNVLYEVPLNIPIIFNDVAASAGDVFDVQFGIWGAGQNGAYIFNETQGLYAGGSFVGVNTIEYEIGEDNAIARYDLLSLEGSELMGEDVVIKDVKQKDLILSVLRLFNLYIIPDKNNPRNLIVKQRENFYFDNEVVKDWTDKVDRLKPISNDLLLDTRVDTLQYRFKDDEDDLYLDLYKGRWGHNYGEKRVDAEYDFSTEIKDVLELDFGTVVPIQYEVGVRPGDTRIEVSENIPNRVRVLGLTTALEAEPNPADIDLPEFERVGIGRTIRIGTQNLEIVDMISPWEFEVNANVNSFNSTTGFLVFNVSYLYTDVPDKVIPAIINKDTKESYNSVPRIAVYNNRVDCNAYSITQTPMRPEGSSLYIWNPDIPKSVSVSQYPYVSHLFGTGPDNSIYDLLFQRPRSINFFTDDYTENNTYSNFYENITESIIASDSRLVTMYIKLDTIDILNLELSDIIFIDGIKYLINKIEGWNAVEGGVSKVELIKYN